MAARHKGYKLDIQASAFAPAAFWSALLFFKCICTSVLIGVRGILQLLFMPLFFLTPTFLVLNMKIAFSQSYSPFKLRQHVRTPILSKTDTTSICWWRALAIQPPLPPRCTSFHCSGSVSVYYQMFPKQLLKKNEDSGSIRYMDNVRIDAGSCGCSWVYRFPSDPQKESIPWPLCSFLWWRGKFQLAPDCFSAQACLRGHYPNVRRYFTVLYQLTRSILCVRCILNWTGALLSVNKVILYIVFPYVFFNFCIFLFQTFIL